MNNLDRKTVGSFSLDLLKDPYRPTTFDQAHEVSKQTADEYIANLTWCVQHALKKVDCSSMKGHEACKDRPAFENDFYVAVLLKKERLMENVLRNYFVPTVACPTPFYDQTIYKWNKAKEALEYLWTIPDKELCDEFMANQGQIHPAEYQLAQHVFDFRSGKLLAYVEHVNNEIGKPQIILEKVTL